MNAQPALAAWTAPSRNGYDASAAATAARVLPMLANEQVVWLSTVRPDGAPHLVPTWFWWDGEALVVYSKPDAVKVRNLRSNPRLMVAVGDPVEDFSVGLIEAEAHVDPQPAAIPEDFFAKYRHDLANARMDAGTFRARYTQAVRIVPTRFLAWRGQGGTHGAELAGPPRRPALAVRIASIVDRLAARLHEAAHGAAASTASSGA